jgi:hypothetical protein
VAPRAHRIRGRAGGSCADCRLLHGWRFDGSLRTPHAPALGAGCVRISVRGLWVTWHRLALRWARRAPADRAGRRRSRRRSAARWTALRQLRQRTIRRCARRRCGRGRTAAAPSTCAGANALRASRGWPAASRKASRGGAGYATGAGAVTRVPARKTLLRAARAACTRAASPRRPSCPRACHRAALHADAAVVTATGCDSDGGGDGGDRDGGGDRGDVRGHGRSNLARPCAHTHAMPQPRQYVGVDRASRAWVHMGLRASAHPCIWSAKRLNVAAHDLRCAATIAAGDRHRTSVMKFVATNQCFLVLLAIRSRTHKKVLRQRHPARRTFAILEGERAYQDVSNCARGHAPHPWAPYSNAITQQRAHLRTASHSGVHERRRPT